MNSLKASGQLRKISASIIILCLVFAMVLIYASNRTSMRNSSSGKPPSLPTSKPTLTNLKIISNNSGRVSWSRSTNLIAYDKQSPVGYYDVWTIKPDGTGDTCLTCGATTLPPLNKGNPVWSPDGRFIALQVQQNPSLGPVGDALARPGAGWNNDLWIMDAAGKNYWPVTHVPAPQGGVIHPQFSWAGNKIVWGQRLATTPEPYGAWELQVGEFVVSAGGVPSVRNITTYTPGAQKYYYEPHGFSLNDRILFFMGNLELGMGQFGMDIYSLDLVTGKLTDLTNTIDQWEEFPTPMPNSNRLVYMSTTGTAWTHSHFEGDLWMMNYDGSNKQRLTSFDDPSSPNYIPDGVSLADPDWNVDGTRLVVYDNLGLGPKYPGQMWLFDFKNVTGQ